jgi:hypothetical protein
MIEAPKMLGGWKALEDLKDKIPPLTRRVIIDISVDDMVRVYTESFVDEKTFELSLVDLVKKAKQIAVADMQKPQWDQGNGLTEECMSKDVNSNDKAKKLAEQYLKSKRDSARFANQYRQIVGRDITSDLAVHIVHDFAENVKRDLVTK